MKPKSNNRTRSRRSAPLPWHGMRVVKPDEALDAKRESFALSTQARERMDLLDRAQPWQILAASRGTGDGATRADIDTAWDRLRRAVER